MEVEPKVEPMLRLFLRKVKYKGYFIGGAGLFLNMGKKIQPSVIIEVALLYTPVPERWQETEKQSIFCHLQDDPPFVSLSFFLGSALTSLRRLW